MKKKILLSSRDISIIVRALDDYEALCFKFRAYGEASYVDRLSRFLSKS